MIAKEIAFKMDCNSKRWRPKS